MANSTYELRPNTATAFKSRPTDEGEFSGSADIEGGPARDRNGEMIQRFFKLQPAARHKRMRLAAHLERHIGRDALSRLLQPPFAGEDQPSHHEPLRRGARLGESSLHKRHIEPCLGQAMLLNLRWLRALVGRARAHQADRDTVGVLDDGVARAPKGIVRLLQAAVTGASHLVVEPVDLLARGHAEAHDHAALEILAAAPARIPPGREGHAVEIEFGTRLPARVQHARMMSARCCPPNILVGERRTEAAVEFYRCGHVAAYNVELIEQRSRIGHGGTMDMKLLEGETALVTGCAGGIGRGIAKALIAEGAKVLGSDIVAPPAEDGIDFLAADLSKRDGWKGLLDGAKGRLSSISLFVHAASPRRLEIDTPLSVSEETWDTMMDINLRSGFFLAREVGRHMRDGKIKGRILIITSQHRITPRNLVHYSAAKAGMTMMMKELARVLAPDGIRVNAIAPGAIPGGGFVADNLSDLVAQIPLGRAGTPDDIAQMAVAMLSERFGRYLVGTTVEIDGGLGLMSWIPSKA